MTPEERLEALQRLAELKGVETPSPVMDAVKSYGKSALRGPVLGAAALLDKGPLMTGGGTVDTENLTPLIPGSRPEGPPASLAGPLTAGDKLRGWLNQVLPPEEGMGHRVAEGVGAGAASRFPIRGALAGGVGTGAASAADSFLSSFPEPIRQAGSAIAGMLAGGGMAALTAPRRTTTLAQDAERDSRILTDLGMNRAGPQVDPSRVANQTSDAANNLLRETRQRNSGVFGTMVDGVMVPRREVAGLYGRLRNLRDVIQRTGRGEDAEALNTAMETLLTGDRQRVMSNLQDLSLSIKRLKENPPAQTASTGRQIASSDLNNAIRLVEAELGTIAPEFQRANDTFRWGQRNLVDPLREGPVGRMADRNPNVASPTPVSRMEGLIQNRGEQDIVGTMLGLRSTGANPQEIARALIQARDSAGGPRPGNRIFGAEGSPRAGEMDALLMSGGMNPQHVTAPFRAADMAAGAAKIPQGEATFATGQLVPRPGISIRGMFKPEWFTGNPEKAQYNEAVTGLLRGASPAEVQQLMQLAQFDPKIRLALTLAGIAVPGAVMQGAPGQ